MTTPAAGTKPIGLPADAQAAKVFAVHLDNFIMTRQLCIFNRDLQKPCSPDTDGNKPYRLAVSIQA
jgi:hypothetical protein